MFAVKGWSVSADKLKSEVVAPTANPEAAKVGKSKKRKRPGSSNNQAVTTANVADMWERVIEHKGPAGKPKSLKDGQKKQKPGQIPRPENATAGTGEGQEPVKKKTLKEKKKEKKRRAAEGVKASAEVTEPLEEEEEWGGLDDEPAVAEEQPRPSKKSKKDKDVPENDEHTPLHETSAEATDVPKAKKDKKDKKKKDKHQSQPTTETAPTPAPATTPALPAPPAVKLTPLQASMREKLISARFRHLNETLYTRPSAEAFTLFKDSPEMFAEYHEGFRRQVGVWPENPVNGYIADIKTRGKVRDYRDHRDRDRRQRFNESSQGGGKPAPLPRSNGTCTIADLGCGDAALAAALQPVAAKLRIEVRSFDLQSGSQLVTRADIANLPLPDGSVDVAVFCLALMGTNWVDFVEEAYRVLKWKGELWVAEIKSRFGVPGAAAGKKKVVEHSVGNRRKSGAEGGEGAGPGKKGKGGKGKDGEEGAAEESELAVEVDGVEDKRKETDVSAFVEVLRKRGFVLRGEPSEAVDLSNKMFVKMSFLKAAPAAKGKCAAAQGDSAAPGRKMKKKFLGDEDDDPVKEAAILKPCLYKIR